MLAAAGSTSSGTGDDRHHAVIGSAAVVGYSRLMADDEPGTLNGWAETRPIAGELMRREPEFRLIAFARQLQPFRQPETGAGYLEGLRAAGMPD